MESTSSFSYRFISGELSDFETIQVYKYKMVKHDLYVSFFKLTIKTLILLKTKLSTINLTFKNYFYGTNDRC